MQTIDAKQLEKKLEGPDRPLLLDVLPRESFEKEHIRGAENVPLASEDFEETVRSLAQGKTREVVVYCASPSCDASPKAALKLAQAGFEHVADFEGGLKEWKESGHELVSA